MRARHVLILLAAQGLAAWWMLADCGAGFPLDDTWIHLVYARALGQGEGFAYNPGQHEAGVTAPLWTALLALPVTISDALGRRPDLAVRILAGITGLLMALAGYRVALRAGEGPALWAGLLLSLDPQLVFDRYSGMEQALFGLLTLLLVDLLIDDKLRRAGLVCGALLLTRPEGAVLALVAVIHVARREPRRLGRLLVPAALCLLPWLAWNHALSGQPWPATVGHKVGLVLDAGAHLRSLAAVFGATGWGLGLPLAALVGAYVLEGGRRGLGRLVLGCGLALLAGVLVSRPIELTGEPARAPWYWARYLLLAWPVLALLVAVGLASLVRTAYAGTRCRPRYAALLIAPLVLVTFLAREVPACAAEVRAGLRGQCAETEALHVAAGRWIAEHLPAGALVATHDAGALRFFGGRPVLDLWANHSGGLARALREGGEAGAAAWLAAQRPDALVVFPALYASGHSPEFQDLWQRLPPQEFEAHRRLADDYASFFGLTRRAAHFHVDAPVVVPSPLHADLAIYLRP